MTYVCITGNEQNPMALEQRVERVLSSHPRVLCELRLDYLDFHPPSAFGFLARLPSHWAPRLIITQRLKASGPVANGNCSWDVNTWQSWWRDVMALRPWFGVDLDWLILDRLAGEALSWRGQFRGRHAFFSLHAPLSEAEELLPGLLASAKEHNAGVKLAVPVEGAFDLERLAILAERLESIPRKTIVAMGAAGRAWRWSRLAGELTYFAAENAISTAPGQDPYAEVLPYLSRKNRPSLYLLLGDNPQNQYGEKRWNRAFLRRGALARYVNTPMLDTPSGEWASAACLWMEKAGIAGASVTKPFKLSFLSPTNTLKRTESGWERHNTDAVAVATLLERYGIDEKARVVIAGGGGAAQAVEMGLREKGFQPILWVRKDGVLGPVPEGDALVSTWPGEFQEQLVGALGSARFRVVVDAQFSREFSPLADWCSRTEIPYEHGSEWWKLQARHQDKFWFGEDRLGAAKAAILALVPTSKSETLRALAISAAFGVSTDIERPSVCSDTEVFADALEKLGVSIDRHGDRWRVYPPARMEAPLDPLHLGEGATGFRLLGALSTQMQGTLKMTGAKGLLSRPHEDLYATLQADLVGEVISIPCGREVPRKVSLERSSQFATGFLIAGAASVVRGELAEYELELEGSRRSESYLRMTMKHLERAGLSVEERESRIRVRAGDAQKKLHAKIPLDASSLAFLEVLAHRWGLASFFEAGDFGGQGDAVFPELLKELETGEFSLRHHPDLAPPLWAAAALGRKKIRVFDCPHLRLKESDRAALLVEAAIALGAEAELRDDGFVADFRRFHPPAKERYLRTEGDHRLAMAFALVGLEYRVVPDRKDCVKKSFPEFWQALRLFEEALPG